MVPRPVSPSPAEPLVPRFYAGRSILITGATGFMGKVLVERILATCPDVGRLHLLMRDKKGHSPQKRLAQLKQSQVFDKVRARNHRQLDKLCVVSGDVSKPQLGMDADSIAQLREVSIVFHSAATLKFDEPLPVAIDQNVRSVQRLLDICDQLPNMQAFIHVSTAYSNAELAVVEERVYPAPVPLAQACTLAETLPGDLLGQINTQYISPKPNTYTFTKALAETVVQEHGNRGYPVAIFRPSIVISSLRHPFPGWIENLNGPSGVVVAAGKGLLHVFCCRSAARADMLPVDMAIDTLLCVAWETAVDRPESVRVYNCSTCENPTTWRQFEAALRHHLRGHPLDNAFWYPCGFTVENKLTQKTLEAVLQTAPLHVAEYISKILGIKTKLSLITVSQRLVAMNDVLRFFSVREWHFVTDNVRKLHARLTPQDAAIYNLDPQTINWDEHYCNFVKGARKYLLQEKDQDIDEAKKHLRRMYYLHQGVLFFVVTLLCRLALQNQYLRAFIYRTFRMLLTVAGSAYMRIRQS
ncbi:putative fatty acyl-CoA reductase CG5065 isoform X1 [Spodoptera frugiperda]|uniref:Fatty acyl-CoA reductase n=2 Tax=Spodoptera frugiperda TaxID=7108 RepID=A0A9R0DJ65_SPOFR|nr:putative fatty acyl-CoA reductase CG5065 isoform X1 [Spodoptera frugiperda]